MKWTSARLKHLCLDSGQYGLNVSAQDYSSTGHRLIRTSDIDETGRLRGSESAVYVDVPIEPRHEVLPGDLLLSRSGTLGRGLLVGNLREKSTYAGYLVRFRPLPTVEPRFMAYTAASEPFQAAIRADAVTSTIQNFNAERYANIAVKYPDLAEQRRIADFLDAETARIDRIRDLQKQAHNLLRLRRDILVDEAFENRDDGRLASSRPLKYAVRHVSVGIVVRPANWYVEAGGVPALRGVNVEPGRIAADDLVRISVEGHTFNAKSMLHAGDVVVVRTGQAGAAAVVPESFDGANCIDLVIIRPGPGLEPKYLEYLLNSGYAGRRIDEYSVGSIQAHFNVGAMKQMPVPIVDIETQRDVVKRLDQVTAAVDRTSATITRQLALLAERRQALITAAVTGQFDVTTARGADLP